MRADVFLDAVIPADSVRFLLPGSALAVRDHARDAVLMAFTPELPFPAEPIVSVRGEPWLVRTARLQDPPFDLVLAAPIAPYAAPFERTGRLGLLALGGVAAFALLLTAGLTARLAASVDRLVGAADTVAGGNLDLEVKPGGPAELHRLAASFNTMTGSLRRMVKELSERRALAAVGEFAASLSHEVRNALTSVQVDLERVEERSEDVKNRAMLARTLAHVRRLDAAVTGALRVARSGTTPAREIPLRDVLSQAVQMARPSFEGADVRLVTRFVDADVKVLGDADALRQLFLYLLLNAQQWSSAEGEVSVAVDGRGDQALVQIHDSGAGMSHEQVSRALDPYYTTRPGGTGLGLPIARQIAIAHGGDLSIRSTAGAGTTVEVRLPCLQPAAERGSLSDNG
jgi:two-component system sensor histidine kinase AtoS